MIANSAVLTTLIFSTFIATMVISLPTSDLKSDTITKFVNEHWHDDKYQFLYETSSGASRMERGYIVTRDDGRQVFVVEGFYSYSKPDGSLYRVNYYADENGYHPTEVKILNETIVDDLDDELISIFKYDTDAQDESLYSNDIKAEPLVSKTIESDVPPPEITRRFPPEVIASLLG